MRYYYNYPKVCDEAQLRHREVKELDQDHTSNKYQIED